VSGLIALGISAVSCRGLTGAQIPASPARVGRPKGYWYVNKMTQHEPQIEMMAVADLVPYARNSRTHGDAQVAQIAASIREFGFTNPVLIDADGGIIAGHGRVLAARKLKMAEVPCIMLDHLTDTQRRAYVIADNQIAIGAGWNEELLSLELNDLHLEGFDMGLMGFDAAELSKLMGFDEEIEAPESSSKEIDPDDYKMGCKCPKCGFEFDDK